MASPLPPGQTDTVDFSRCFRFLGEDPDWMKKLLIGGAFTLLSSLIVGIFFVAGYWVRFVKRVAASDPEPMPDWDDLGGIFRDGLQVVGVYFVHLLGVGIVVGAFGCAGGLFLFAIGGLGGSSEGAGQAAGALVGMGIAGLYAVAISLFMVMMLYLPAAFVRVALRGQFAEGFNWRANIEFIRANLANYGLSLVFGLVANFVAQFGVLLCCVGVFPAAFAAYLVVGFALGETVRLGGRPV